LNPEPVNVQK